MHFTFCTVFWLLRYLHCSFVKVCSVWVASVVLWTLGYSDKYFLGLLCYLQYYVILDKKTTSLKLYMNAWNLLKLLISNLFHLGTMQCRKETRNIYKADTITNPYTKMNCFKLQTRYDSANSIQENISELIFI